MFRNRTIATWIGADKPAVVTDHRLWPYLAGKIGTAFLANQLPARQDLWSLEKIERSTFLARGGLYRCGLTFSAHRVADPTSSGHAHSFFLGLVRRAEPAGRSSSGSSLHFQTALLARPACLSASLQCFLPRHAIK